MGRRKKEPAEVHRQRIAQAAAELFMEKGISAATMDDVAAAAGYSKATLYVYFQKKEEIVGLLTLAGMTALRDVFRAALAVPADTRRTYDALCQALLAFAEQSPLYFDLTLREIHFDPSQPGALPVEADIFQVGEEINADLCAFLQAGIAAGDLRAELPVLPTVLAFWGMLSGFLRLAMSKEAYLRQSTGLTRQAFLQQGFDILYRSIAAREGV